jgi:hypothetical protein
MEQTRVWSVSQSALCMLSCSSRCLGPYSWSGLYQVGASALILDAAITLYIITFVFVLEEGVRYC